MILQDKQIPTRYYFSWSISLYSPQVISKTDEKVNSLTWFPLRIYASPMSSLSPSFSPLPLVVHAYIFPGRLLFWLLISDTWSLNLWTPPTPSPPSHPVSHAHSLRVCAHLPAEPGCRGISEDWKMGNGLRANEGRWATERACKQVDSRENPEFWRYFWQNNYGFTLRNCHRYLLGPITSASILLRMV